MKHILNKVLGSAITILVLGQIAKARVYGAIDSCTIIDTGPESISDILGGNDLLSKSIGTAHILQCPDENGFVKGVLNFYDSPIDHRIQKIDRYAHFDAQTIAKINYAILSFALDKFALKVDKQLPVFISSSDKPTIFIE